jgi:hypothetical protein
VSIDYLSEAADLVKGLACDQFDRLWNSREAMFQLITDPNPNVRAAAMICGYTKWRCGYDYKYQMLCRQMAKDDSGQPREVAITYLAEIFRNTQDRDIQRILAHIVCDSAETPYMRNHAYRALRDIECGFDPEVIADAIRDTILLTKGQPVAMMRIDWHLVEQLAGEEKGENGDKGETKKEKGTF